MRYQALVVAGLIGCGGYAAESETCEWTERVTPAEAPPDQCARYSPKPGYEEHTRFRRRGDQCTEAQPCVLLQPGESAIILGSPETANEVNVTVELGDCAALECP